MIPAAVAVYAVFENKPLSKIYAVVGFQELTLRPYLVVIGGPLIPAGLYNEDAVQRLGVLLTFPTYEAAEVYRQGVVEWTHKAGAQMADEAENALFTGAWSL